jgi:hypothetical protein
MIQRSSQLFEEKHPPSILSTFRHLPNVNQPLIHEMIKEKQQDEPFVATYDRPQAMAVIDHRTPFTEWYLGQYADTVPTVYERDAGMLPRQF